MKIIKDVIDYNRFEMSLLVFDFDIKKIINKKEIGIFILETDFREYLPMPSWDDNCSKVSFFIQQHMKSPVSLTVE